METFHGKASTAKLQLKIITAKQPESDEESFESFPDNSAQIRSPLLLGLPRGTTFFNLIRCNTKNSEVSPFCDFDIFELSAFKTSHDHDFNPKNLRNINYADCIEIIEKNDYEIIENSPTFNEMSLFLKALKRISTAISELCMRIYKTKGFRVFIFLVILANTLTLALTTSSLSAQDDSGLEIFFLVTYTTEFFIKLFSLGPIRSKSSYFRKKWNLLDFLVLVTFWLDMTAGSSFNLQVLRSLRILRPLKSITSLKALRIIIKSIGSSIRPLAAAMTLFFLFILIFAIGGMQLWSGLFHYRCMELETGFMSNSYCGSANCSDNQKCVRGLDNPGQGIVNFDNIFFASIVVYEIITLEGWVDIMIITQKTFSSLTILYFLPLVFIGALVFLNLFMVIIKSALSKTIIKGSKSRKPTANWLESRILASKFSLDEENKISQDFKSEFLSPGELSYSPVRSDLFSFNWQSEMRPDHQNDGFEKITCEFNSKKPSELMPEDSEMLQSYINYNTVKAAKLFERINGKLPITRVAFSRLQTENHYDLTKVSIKLFTLDSESSIDVKPLSRTLTLDNFAKVDKRVFVYKTNEEVLENPIRCWDKNREEMNESFVGISTDFRIFCRLTLKYNEEVAFELINNQVAFFCKKLEKIESETKYIEGIWSGRDVCEISSHEFLSRLNKMTYSIWKKDYWGYVEKFRFPLLNLIDSKVFNVLLIFSVVANTLVLSIDHYGISTEMQTVLQNINLVFTYIFIFEMGLKLVALGSVRYVKDSMNLFDGSIVILSIIELTFTSGTKSVISAFRTARIFRIFKVLRILRVAKIFRYLHSMAHIIAVISKSVTRYMYIGLLLFILMMVYTILGMQIFSGNFSSSSNSRANFDSFHSSFLSTFQILSVENWQSILYAAMNSQAGYASCLYFISWIILGNYIILNLFLAILLENFSESNVEDSVKERKNRLFEGHSIRMSKRLQRNMRMLDEMNSDSEDEQISNQSQSLKNTILANPGKTLCLFSIENKIRRFCMNLTFSQSFEFFILIIILVSSIKLAVDTYLSESTIALLDPIDKFFSAIFFAEFLIKIISRGFIFGDSSYLKDKWNYIDFVVVISSIFDFTFSSIKISHVKVVRLLRTLRPFRYINYNTSMKVVVVSLLQSIVAILNVIIVQVIVLLMFAILGVSLFAGKLYKCSESQFDSRDLCEKAGFTWTELWPNFDNVWNTFITLMILSSEEGWPDIMYSAIDATDVDKGPVYNSNPYVAYYFVVFITISSFLFMNLFVGVVYEKFNEARKHESSLAASILSKDQMIWIEMQKFIIKSSPGTKSSQTPTGRLKGFCFNIIETPTFDVIVVIVIILNMVSMAMIYEEAGSQYTLALDTCNLVFSIFFFCEATIKIIGYGSRMYFASISNIFDFAVVVVSCTDIFLTYVMGSRIILLRRGPQLIRSIKVFRISKFIRLFKILKPLKKLLDIIFFSLPAFGNVMALLILIFYIYAILGYHLFGEIDSGRFSSFSNAMFTLFRSSTGEDWYKIMFECGKSQGMVLAETYFLTFMTLVVFVMLNLFIMVIIQSYEEYDKNPETVQFIFEQATYPIKAIWNLFAKESKGIRVHVKDLPEIMRNLNEFGINFNTDNLKIMRFLKALQLDVDKDGFVYYNQFLFAVLKKKFLKKDSNNYFRKIAGNEEKKTKRAVEKIIKRQQKKFWKKEIIAILRILVNFLWKRLNEEYYKRVEELC